MNNALINSHPHQLEIAKDNTRFKVAVSGRRWGKSVLGREMILAKAFDMPGSLSWIVTPTREMNKDIHWDALKQRVKELNWRVKINETNLSITKLIGGSKIILKTADNPDRLRGRGLDFVVIDEFRDMDQSVWQDILRPALTDKKGEALFISTPNGHDILYDLYLLGQGENPEWKSWHYRTIDSPFIDAHEIEQAKNDLDKMTFEREYEASFDTAGGNPYYSYTNLNNKPFELNSYSPVIFTCDFNATEKPMSWVVGQRVIEGITDITNWKASLSYQYTNTEVMCKIADEWLLKNLRTYPSHLIFYGDYAGRQQKSNSSFSDWQIIEDYFRNKAKIEKRIKPCRSIRDSIAATNAQLANTKGERKQFVDPEGCKELIEDWNKCEWKTNGRELKDNDNFRGHLCRAVDYYNDFEHSIKFNKNLNNIKLI